MGWSPEQEAAAQAAQTEFAKVIADRGDSMSAAELIKEFQRLYLVAGYSRLGKVLVGKKSKDVLAEMS